MATGALFLSALFMLSVAQRDDTVIPEAKGREVVESTLLKIESACIFEDDRLFMRRLAQVESRDGEHPDTYRPEYHGGIWQVDEEFFKATQQGVATSVLYVFIQTIQQSFGIDWSTVTWQDLRKPLHSALSARLYLEWAAHNDHNRIPHDIENQAVFWKARYRNSGDTDYFSEIIRDLNVGCENRYGRDVVFVLESSDAVGHVNFKAMKEFVKDVVHGFDIGMATEHTQVGIITFSTNVRREIDLGSYSSKDRVISAIDGISYMGGDHALTHSALDEVTFQLFSKKNGARSVSHPRVAIVLTSSQSKNPPLTIMAAIRANDKSITVFAIGIGADVDMNELSVIVSEPTCPNLFLVKDFEELLLLKDQIAKKSCEAPVIINPREQESNPEGKLKADGVQNCKLRVPPEGANIRIKVKKGGVNFYTSTAASPSPSFYEKMTSATVDSVGVMFIPKPPTEDEEGIIYCSLKGSGYPENEYVIEIQTGDLHTAPAKKQNKKPNFIVILMDDMGWGDMGVFGNPSRETPNMDKMAAEGMILLDFYAASPVCSPSRASLLTGRLPIRNGFYTDNGQSMTAFVTANSVGGIADSEILVSELLKENGYKNMFIGKWHLGHLPQYNPLRHGFHEYFGSPDNHDGPFNNVDKPNIPVYKNESIDGRYFQGDYNIIDGESNTTKMFLEEGLTFINKNAKAGDPFFLLYSPDGIHKHPYASKQYLNTSERGIYGDALREMDAGVGAILQTLKNLSISNDTLVFFSSDNGGATYAAEEGGINGPFLCGKFTNFEGGQRVPAVAWWPNHIKPNQISKQPGSLMDLFATFLELADVPIPDDRILDSTSLVTRFFKGKEEEERPIFYYRGNEIFAVRYGLYKAYRWVFANPEPNYNYWDFCPGQDIKDVTTSERIDHSEKPLLFHLGKDPGEKYVIEPDSEEYNKVMPKIHSFIEDHNNNLVKGEAILNYCDVAAYSWAPEGCEEINQCLPVPPSSREKCVWPF